MNKKLRTKYKNIFIFIILFIILFHKSYVLASDELKESKFKLTYYGDQETNYNSLGSGLTYKDFKVNSKYGWYEYEKDRKKYVVIAAATEELLAEMGAEKQDHIHYFKYNDTIKFKFADEKMGNEQYYGIILYSCEASMEVQNGEPQILSIYVKNEEDSKYEAFNQQIVWITDDGTFSNNAGKTKSKKDQNFITKFFINMFCGLGDIINTWVNDTANNVRDPESLPIDATRAQIEAYDELKEQINLTDAKNEETKDTEIGNEQVNEENKNQDKDKSKQDKNTIATVKMSDKIDNSDGTKQKIYSETTKIPIISTDIYSMSINKVDLFNINFFEKGENKSNEWKIIGNFVFNVSHVVIYIAEALLLVMIIWRAVVYIFSTVTGNPGLAKESKAIIDSLAKSVIILVGIYVVMALMIGFYNQIVKLILNGNESEYVIRVVVDNVYAFNTNFVGYIKFLSLRSNGGGAMGYSFIYLIMTFVNVTWFLLMFLRVLVIGVLVIIAPLTSVTSMVREAIKSDTKINSVLNFKSWMRIFMIWLWIPFVAILVLKIILRFM